MSEFRVPLAEALDPLVLALDVGSTASRGGLYDAAGRPVLHHRHKVPHQFTTGTDGTSTIDADQVVAEVEEIITTLARRELKGRIAGVSLDTFASSLVGVSADGRALTPCVTYADSRCAAQVTALRAELDEQEVRRRTGTRLHSSYLPARFRWLRETAPSTFASVERWMSLGEYVHLRMLGTTAVGTSTAAWTGLLDRRTGEWDHRMLEVSGIALEQLSEIRDPDRPLEADSRWKALKGARWFPVITDGLASNLGAGADNPATIAAAAATSGAMRVLVSDLPDELPPGLWCYRVDAKRSLLGGALNDVGRAASWLDVNMRLDGVDRAAVLAAEPDPATPTVLPYFSGERATGWAADARALLADVSAATTAPMLYRGTMEGVALSYARVASQLQQVAGQTQQILASGRVTQDLPTWLQVLADALGAPVVPVTIKRSTLHGTALLALDTLAPGVERRPVDVGPTHEPVPARAEYYADRAARYEQLYRVVIAES